MTKNMKRLFTEKEIQRFLKLSNDGSFRTSLVAQ